MHDGCAKVYCHLHFLVFAEADPLRGELLLLYKKKGYRNYSCSSDARKAVVSMRCGYLSFFNHELQENQLYYQININNIFTKTLS